jgi:hypothetical protein
MPLPQQARKPKRRRIAALVRLGASKVSKVKVLVWIIQNPVSDGNCVLVRGGGEQPDENASSVAIANSIRPAVLASLRVTGEAQVTRPCPGLDDLLARAFRSRYAVGVKPGTPWRRTAGGWRRRGSKAFDVNKGSLSWFRLAVPDYYGLVRPFPNRPGQQLAVGLTGDTNHGCTPVQPARQESERP